MERNFWLLCAAVLGLIVVGPHCTKDTGGGGGSTTTSTGTCTGSGGCGAANTGGCGDFGCGDGSDGVWQDGSGTGATGGTTSTGGGGMTTSSENWGGGDGVSSPTCLECACTYKSTDSWAGCADKCDQALNGGTADFCDQAPQVSEVCALCIKDTCGQVDPTMCF